MHATLLISSKIATDSNINMFEVHTLFNDYIVI